jgi:peptidoglycan hydrolase-like protein with peptidoglycan-binding domain
VVKLRAVLLALTLTAGVPAFAAAAAKAPAKKTAPKKTAPKKKAVARRPSPPKQMEPTPERYREIQQALIDRGFLDGEPSGKWDERTVEAWKRFEESAGLPVDGKLDAKALIALGLAPNRQAALTAGGN